MVIPVLHLVLETHMISQKSDECVGSLTTSKNYQIILALLLVGPITQIMGGMGIMENE